MILTLRRDVPAELLKVTDQALYLEADVRSVDALLFQSLAQSMDPATQKGCLDITWAPFMDRFPPVSEAFDKWVVTERQQLESGARRTFLDLLLHFDQIGDVRNAIRSAEQLADIDPDRANHLRLVSLELRHHGYDAAFVRAKSLIALRKGKNDADFEVETAALLEAAKGIAAESDDRGAGSFQIDIQTAPPAALSRVPQRRGRTAMAAGLALLVVGGLALLLTPHNTVSLVLRETPEANRQTERANDSWIPPQAMRTAKERGLIPIAVLPFKSYATDDDRGIAIAEIVTDNLTTVLARIPTFRVISRQTAATYKDRNLEAAKIADQLKVDYLVEGSALQHDGKLYISVELIDGKTQSMVWSGRYERPGDGLGSLLGEVVYGLGRELQIEVSHLAPQQVGDLTLEKLVLQGWSAIDRAGTKGASALGDALASFNAALEINPDHVSARLGRAAYHTQMALQLIAPDTQSHLAKAEAILSAELVRNPNISSIHSLMGLVDVARNRTADALRHFKQAVALNPSHAPSHAQIGRLLVREGKAQEGFEHIKYAMRLSPRDPAMSYWLGFAGFAELELGNYDRAISELTRAHALNPGQALTMLTLIAAHAQAGDLPKARALLAELQGRRPHLTDKVLSERFGKIAAAKKSESAEGILRTLKASP
ncbi:tetratricopeptide repeat protein [Pseudorhodoplanes sp.]|uniref:tetratricopeptide repeat protein n=1 Tax=Pseudorhodoplanes sp. TaxID=1934341 RepID=UPI003919919B